MYSALLAGSSSIPRLSPSDWFCWLTEPTFKMTFFLKFRKARIRFYIIEREENIKSLLT